MHHYISHQSIAQRSTGRRPFYSAAFYFFFIFHFSLLLLFFTACDKEITYHGPDEQPMLVVNILAEAGSPVAVEVSRSVFFLKVSEENTADLNLRDAAVSLSINGTSATLAYDPEYSAYLDSRLLREGDDVSVVVTHPTYGKATASMTVPVAARAHFDSRFTAYIPKDSVTTAQVYTSVDTHARTDSVWHASLVIDDIKGSTGFYRLTINPSYTFRVKESPGLFFLTYNGYVDYIDGENGTATIQAGVSYTLPSSTKYVLDANSTDPIDDLLGIIPGLDDSGDGYYSYPSSYLFTGDYFNTEGSTAITFDIYMHTPFWSGGKDYFYHPDWHYYEKAYYLSDVYYDEVEDPMEDVDYGNPWDILDPDIVYTVNATLETLTPEYYYYLKSVEKYDNSTWSPFSEPVQITCNIDGGIGIMAATSERSFSVSRAYTFPVGN